MSEDYTTGCKDIVIRKCMFVTRTQFLSFEKYVLKNTVSLL